jgi:hypothetical protein
LLMLLLLIPTLRIFHRGHHRVCHLLSIKVLSSTMHLHLELRLDIWTHFRLCHLSHCSCHFWSCSFAVNPFSINLVLFLIFQYIIHCIFQLECDKSKAFPVNKVKLPLGLPVFLSSMTTQSSISPNFSK